MSIKLLSHAQVLNEIEPKVEAELLQVILDNKVDGYVLDALPRSERFYNQVLPTLRLKLQFDELVNRLTEKYVSSQKHEVDHSPKKNHSHNTRKNTNSKTKKIDYFSSLSSTASPKKLSKVSKRNGESSKTSITKLAQESSIKNCSTQSVSSDYSTTANTRKNQTAKRNKIAIFEFKFPIENLQSSMYNYIKNPSNELAFEHLQELANAVFEKLSEEDLYPTSYQYTVATQSIFKIFPHLEEKYSFELFHSKIKNKFKIMRNSTACKDLAEIIVAKRRYCAPGKHFKNRKIEIDEKEADGIEAEQNKANEEQANKEANPESVDLTSTALNFSGEIFS